MGYRTNDKPPKPEDHLRRFDVRNGATMKVAFGCYYAEPKPGLNNHRYYDWLAYDSAYKDYPPYKYSDYDFNPIHLTEEGYTNAVIVLDEPSEYLTATAWIDEETDNIVHILVDTSYPKFEDKPKDIRFTVFVSKENENPVIKDAVCHAMLTVLPGSPYPTGD